ncbi:MAG: N-acetylglucosamine-6-phosphate deacetylase [Planctomycetota bacterium]|nr:N-acetylglucosamine-6-phosphate deacetylase [Planctomycetota bacterium]MDA1178212.1 N-acetylglucosamine-6-phosphate deacetylase [Planctomycetota bacterium]
MIDLQVNGYHGIDFNDPQLTHEQFRAACESLIADGITGCLPTIITADLEQMQACLRRIRDSHRQDEIVRQVVMGVHIEGPFLNSNPGFIGAHPPQHARIAKIEATQRLLDAAGSLTRIFTLAPECDPRGTVTQYLVDRGIVVAAGHTDATLDELRLGLQCGMSMFTHLGNGCPSEMHRHDNIIQRALSLSSRMWVSLIADGAHLPWFVFDNFLSRISVDRVIVVSDAISAAGLGPGTYQLGGTTVSIGTDLVPCAPDRSHFIGASTTMRQAHDNLVGQGYSDETAHRLCVINPQRVLRREKPTP